MHQILRSVGQATFIDRTLELNINSIMSLRNVVKKHFKVFSRVKYQ